MIVLKLSFLLISTWKALNARELQEGYHSPPKCMPFCRMQKKMAWRIFFHGVFFLLRSLCIAARWLNEINHKLAIISIHSFVRISRQPHGRSFVVHKPKDFVAQIMLTNFRQTKITSFQRQLNLYGFSRITAGRDRGGYYHENFLRHELFLCQQMVSLIFCR